MSQFCDINVPLTRDLFDSLAQALQIRWPNWYRQLVFGLLDPPPRYADRWLPGGFLFANPQLTYQHTMFQRNAGMNRRTRTDSLERVPWPVSHVIVGHCGDGDVVIDVSTEIPSLLILYKEDYVLRPFIDLRDKTPTGYAQLLHESQRQAKG